MSAHLSEIYGLVPAIGIVHVVIPAVVLWLLILVLLDALDKRRW